MNHSLVVRLRRHLPAALGLLFLVLCLSWRVVFLGETFVDAATLQNQLPWGATGPTYLDHSYNRRDITDTYITREYFLVDSFKRGEWPMWSPYNFTGHPAYADGVLRMLSPFNLLYAVFDVPRGYDLTCLLQLFLTGLFAYFYFFGIGLRRLPAFFGAATFMLASLTLFHVTSSGWLGGLMWLPLILLGIDRAIRANAAGWAVFSGLCFALQFYCGYMANAIYYLGALVTYGAFFALLRWRRENGFTRFGNIPAKLAVAVLVGFGLSAAHWMPIFELLGYSNRKIVPTELAPNWLPPWYLATSVMPHLFGEAYDPKFAVLFVGIGVSHAHVVYFSIAGLFLVLFSALVWWTRKRHASLPEDLSDRLGYFLFLLVLSTFVMCAVPLYVHVTKYLPVLQTIRVTNRVSVLFTFSIGALAAIGMECFSRVDPAFRNSFFDRARRAAVGVLALIGLAVGGVTALARTGTYQTLMLTFDQQKRVVRAPLALSENFDALNPDYFPATFVSFGFIALTAFILFLHRRGRISDARVLPVLVAVALADLIWHGRGFNETYPRSLVFHPSPAIDFLKSDRSVHRVVVAPANFNTKGQADQSKKIVAPPNTLVPYQIQTVSGKDQLFPNWFREMAAAVHAQNYLSHVVFTSPSSKWFDLWNVKYVMTRADTRFPDEAYIERFVGDGVRIYENTRAKPRAFFIPRAIVVPDTPLKRRAQPDETVKKMKAPDFDPLATAFVQGDIPAGEILHADAGDRVTITEYRNNLARISTASGSAGVLVLSDTFYPGWKVFVDGQERPVLRVDHALRGVFVPAGEHAVEFRFAPRRFIAGCAVSLGTLALVAGLGLGGAIRRRGRRTR